MTIMKTQVSTREIMMMRRGVKSREDCSENDVEYYYFFFRSVKCDI